MRPSPTKPLQIYWKQRVGDFRPFSAHAEPEYHVCSCTLTLHTTHKIISLINRDVSGNKITTIDAYARDTLPALERMCVMRDVRCVVALCWLMWFLCDTVTSKATRLFPWLSYFCRLSHSWLHCNHLCTLDCSCSDVFVQLLHERRWKVALFR